MVLVVLDPLEAEYSRHLSALRRTNRTLPEAVSILHAAHQYRSRTPKLDLPREQRNCVLNQVLSRRLQLVDLAPCGLMRLSHTKHTTTQAPFTVLSPARSSNPLYNIIGTLTLTASSTSGHISSRIEKSMLA
ncbi:hypothetical protein C8Q73DRAFT_7724 [Cubamyces lactineus]|nr:hypothetical protein C8Q73DRAFT_7724 [Cubamyces lactineus]